MKIIASLVILASTCTAFNSFNANKKALPKVNTPIKKVASKKTFLNPFNANKKAVPKVNTPTKKVASKKTLFNANKKAVTKVNTTAKKADGKKTLSRRDVLLGAGAAAISTSFFDVEFLDVVQDRTPLPPINGIYSDPNHKNGYRVVRVVGKSNAVVTLQDEPNSPIISVDGKIKSKKSGTTITLDFSPKGGPKDIVATFYNGSGGDQLLFSDGNVWTKSVGVDGIYSDPNHPAGYRAVRVDKGKMYITLQDDPKGEVIDVVGKKAKSGYLLDFSSKGGPKDIAATVEDGKLIFPDGNAWTRAD